MHACHVPGPTVLPLKKSDFYYDLPSQCIAQRPLQQRSASRLLLLDGADRSYQDRAFRDLPELLGEKDLLVFNDTRVLPARLHAHKQSGGGVEILIERMIRSNEALAQIRVSRKPAEDSLLRLSDGTPVRVLGREGEFFRLRFETSEPLSQVLVRLGHTPLPPYIEREDDATDTERYQTVFARHPGAVAAPTAGLHFDAELLQRLRARGVDFGFVTLHVGAGTFQPVRVEDLSTHVMHREWLQVDAGLVEHIRSTRARGGRVIGVGTTVVRALESAAATGELQPFSGDTRLFILPGYQFTQIDALITNFHLPESTLLMLVSALAGRERIMDAYQHAIQTGYRFFSYGDAMLIMPGPDSPGGRA